MKRRAFLFSAAAASSSAAQLWTPARPGHSWQFPRDHYSHDGYRTEWWYLTGILRDQRGHSHGFQFTIFRRGLRPPGQRPAARSRFVVDDFAMGHFTLSDVEARRFRYRQEISRGAFGEAGFGAPGQPRLAWIGKDEIRCEPDGSLAMVSHPDEASAISLRMTPTGPPVIHGENGEQGVSRKAAGEDNASLYYSLTRMKAEGIITTEGTAHPVTGQVWLDREWASNQLAPDQIGWDWFSLSLSDGSDLMLYRLRTANGTDPFSSGTLVRPGAAPRHLKSGDFTMKPLRTWKSPATGGAYPMSWEIAVPSAEIGLSVQAVFPEQELALQPVSYWEGMVRATGTSGAQPIDGEGYLEMTGYAAPLQALQR
jgi:predicted secreted hydrolase